VPSHGVHAWAQTFALDLVHDLYFALESVRELLGPPGVLGNRVVIWRDDGACVLVAHLKRHSVRVAVGDRVERGTVVGACENSGNSTEPHLHVEAMDRAGVWLAQGRPLLIDVGTLPEHRPWTVRKARQAEGARYPSA